MADACKRDKERTVKAYEGYISAKPDRPKSSGQFIMDTRRLCEKARYYENPEHY